MTSSAVDSTNEKEPSSTFHKRAGIGCVLGLAGMVGSGLLGGLLGHGSGIKREVLSDRKSIKVYGATISVDGWKLTVDASNTEKFLYDNPQISGKISFRVINGSREHEVTFTPPDSSYRIIPGPLRPSIKKLSDQAEMNGLPGLKDNQGGQLGVNVITFDIGPSSRGSVTLLVIIQRSDPGKLRDGIPNEAQTVEVIDVVVHEYKAQIASQPRGHVSVTSSSPLSPEDLANVSRWHEKVNEVLGKKFFDFLLLECASRDSNYDPDSWRFRVDPKSLKEEKSYNDSVAEAVYTQLKSKLKDPQAAIPLDTTSTVELLEFERFVFSKPIGVESSQKRRYLGYFNKQGPVSRFFELNEYLNQRSQLISWTQGMVSTPGDFAAGIETAARVYPEEFKNRFSRLSPEQKSTVKTFMLHTFPKFFDEDVRAGLVAPSLTR